VANVEVDFGGKQAVADSPVANALVENKIIPEVVPKFTPTVDLT